MVMELMAWAMPSAQYVFKTKVAMKAALDQVSASGNTFGFVTFDLNQFLMPACLEMINCGHIFTISAFRCLILRRVVTQNLRSCALVRTVYTVSAYFLKRDV